MWRNPPCPAIPQHFAGQLRLMLGLLCGWLSGGPPLPPDGQDGVALHAAGAGGDELGGRVCVGGECPTFSPLPCHSSWTATTTRATATRPATAATRTRRWRGSSATAVGAAAGSAAGAVRRSLTPFRRHCPVGICTDASYPYIAGGGQCKPVRCGGAAYFAHLGFTLAPSPPLQNCAPCKTTCTKTTPITGFVSAWPVLLCRRRNQEEEEVGGIHASLPLLCRHGCEVRVRAA